MNIDLAPTYSESYGQRYAEAVVKIILKKPEFDCQDLNILYHSYDNRRYPVFTNCTGYINSKFHELYEKAIKFYNKNNEVSRFDLVSMCEKHTVHNLFGFESIFETIPDTRRLLKTLTPFEIRRLDEFTRYYVESRGLFIKAAKNGVRVTSPYHAWVQRVKMNDNFTCQRCGSKEDLNAHHIIPVSRAPELATDLNNGITLCEKCHKSYHSCRKEHECRAETLNGFINYYQRARANS